jgi:hypothetical protein
VAGPGSIPSSSDDFLHRLSPQDRDEFVSISADIVQLLLDLAGFVDPTPISDGASTLLAIARGNWLDAGLSAIGMVPYIGDLAKAGKLPRYLSSVERAIALAERSADAAAALLPALTRLDDLLAMMPSGATVYIDRMRTRVGSFIRNNAARTVNVAARTLPDIRHMFDFPMITRSGSGRYWVKEARGRLGVPGTVAGVRNNSAQRMVSGGSGDDAGHLIGTQFGAPGDARNLSRQNWVQNQGGGTFHSLEDAWAGKLRSGVGVEVRVRDFSPIAPGTNPADPASLRPLYRKVEWTEIQTNGVRTQHEMLFVNPHTADAAHRAGSRTQQGIPATVPPDNKGRVIDVDFAAGTWSVRR